MSLQGNSSGVDNLPGSPTGKKKRLLLIDDEPLTRLVLMNELRNAGIDVDTAPSGRGALVKLRRGYPDAIFLGLPLRDIDGVELIKEIRRDPQFKARPIYVCDSTFPVRNRGRKAMEAGATKVFDKLATPMHVILAEMLADLPCEGLPVTPPTLAADEGQSTASTQVSGKIHEGVAALSRRLQLLAQCKQNEARALECCELHSLAQTIVKDAAAAGLQRAGRHAAAFEAFLKELCHKPQDISESTLHTMGLAIEALEVIAHNSEGEELQVSGFFAVVVDDDPASGREMCAALSDAGFTSCTFADPAAAMSHLGSHRVDVVVLELGMAAQNGSDLYTRIHELPSSQQTSVILVTKPTSPRSSLEVLSLCDTQFLVKPESATNYLEIALKASSRALKNRLTNRSATPAVSPKILAAEESNASRPTLVEPVTALSEGVVSEALSPEKNEGPVAPSVELPEVQPQIQEPDSALRKANEELKEQLEAVSAKAEAYRDTLNKRDEERKNLGERIFFNERELNRARAALEQETEQRKHLEQELQNLAAAKVAPADQAEQQSRLESSFHAQLNAAKEAAEQAETALQQEVVRSKKFEERLRILRENLKQEQIERGKRFEEEVVRLRQKHEELQARTAGDEQGAAQSRQRCEELQSRLEQNAIELQRVQEKLKEREEDKARLESELQAQLNATKAAAEQAEATLKQKAEQCSQLEEELANLRREHRELQAMLAAEHEKSEASRRKAEELESRLRENAAELERVRAELQKAGHSQQVQEELASLRRRHEQIHAELTAEQQATAQARQISEELENRLRRKSAELERIQADRNKRLAERSRLESEVQTRTEKAKVVAGQMETARAEEAERLSQMQQTLAQLQQVQEELRARMTAGPAPGDSRGRSQELENELRHTIAELERVQADRARQMEEQARLELELCNGIDAAKQAAEQAEAALKEGAAGNLGLKERLRLLHNNFKLQQLAADTQPGSPELDAWLSERNEELERVKRELQQQAAERARLEAELADQRSAAKAAVEKAEAACHEEAERSKRLEADLATLQQAHREISGKLETAQGAMAEPSQRVQELESRLAELWLVCDELHTKLAAQQQAMSAETRRVRQELETQLAERNEQLDRVKGELEQQASARTHSDSDLSDQRAAASAAMAESRRRGEALESQLASLRFLCEELNGKLVAEQQVTAETRRGSLELAARLGERNEEFQRVKREFEQQIGARTRLESELGEQRTAAEMTEAAYRKEAQRSAQFEHELVGLWQIRDALKAQLAIAQQAAGESKGRVEELQSRLSKSADELASARTELKQQTAERARLEAQHASLAQSNGALNTELSLFRERQLAHDHELSAMQSRVGESTTSLARVTAELDTERGERRRVEERASTLAVQLQELRTELTSHLQVEKENQSRIAGLERQLREREEALGGVTASLDTERAKCCRVEERASNLAIQLQELHVKLTRHLQVEQDNQNRVADLERQLREREETLVRVTANLETERTERRRVEERASTIAVQLQELHTELSKHLQIEKDNQNKISGLERELRERGEALTRVTADFETERGERRRVEERSSTLAIQLQELHTELTRHLQVEKDNQSRVVDLERQLREGEEGLARMCADLEKVAADRDLADEQLHSAESLIAQLRQYPVAFDETKNAFARTQEQLESRLQATSNLLTERDAKLQKEVTERQRLAEVLAATQQTLQTQSQNSVIELAKLRSALDVESMERRRLEGEAAHSRYALLNSVRAGRGLLNGLRSQNQRFVDELMQSTRRLLELGLHGEHKKLAESVLETVLALQMSVRQSGLPEFSSNGGDGEGQSEPGELIPLACAAAAR